MPTLLKTHRTGDFRLLYLTSHSAVAYARWLTGKEPQPPGTVTAEWSGDPGAPRPDFPCNETGVEVFADRVAERIHDLVGDGGVWIPVLVDGAASGYHLFACTTVVDCLDVRRSSKPRKQGSEIRLPRFLPEAVPTDVPAFRVPQSPCTTVWDARALDEVLSPGVTGLTPRVVWSSDPAYGGQVSALGNDSIYTDTVHGRAFDRWP